MKEINFKKPVLLQSKVNESLIVLNIPDTKTAKDQFKGIILTVENSVSGNKDLDHSSHYRRDKFKLYNGGIKAVEED